MLFLVSALKNQHMCTYDTSKKQQKGKTLGMSNVKCKQRFITVTLLLDESKHISRYIKVSGISMNLGHAELLSKFYSIRKLGSRL